MGLGPEMGRWCSRCLRLLSSFVLVKERDLEVEQGDDYILDLQSERRLIGRGGAAVEADV